MDDVRLLISQYLVQCQDGADDAEGSETRASDINRYEAVPKRPDLVCCSALTGGHHDPQANRLTARHGLEMRHEEPILGEDEKHGFHSTANFRSMLHRLAGYKILCFTNMLLALPTGFPGLGGCTQTLLPNQSRTRDRQTSVDH